MADIDPLKVVRNPETLEAYRRYRREMWARAQPWLTIAIVAALTGIGLFLSALFRNSFHDLSLFFSLVFLVYGLSFGIASVRIWHFRRTRPLELP